MLTHRAMSEFGDEAVHMLALNSSQFDPDVWSGGAVQEAFGRRWLMRLAANKIACALISMMARSTCSNRRPNTLTQDRISQRRPKPLAPRGRTIHWVKSAALDVDHALPVYPNKRTFSEPRLTSQKGQFRTSVTMVNFGNQPCRQFISQRRESNGLH
jgi:hypothetical protein